MKFEPDLDNKHRGARWHHIASEAEITRTIKAAGNTVYEVPMICMTFIVSHSHLTCVRCTGSIGGGTLDIEGGWVYASDLLLRFDEQEWRQMSEHPANGAF